jgi:hypothetical protein
VVAGGGANFDPSVFQLYADHGTDDPYKAPTIKERRIGLISGEEFVSHKELVKTELYNEVLRRFGLEHVSLLSCTSREDKIEVISLWRDRTRGPIGSRTSQILELLVPHVQLALGLRSRLRDLRSIGFFSELSLEAMAVAAILVTG